MTWVIITPIPKSQEELIAISAQDHDKYGCPYCDNKNYDHGQFFISNRDTQIWECEECNKFCVVIINDVFRSTIVFQKMEKIIAEKIIVPSVTEHPLRSKKSK